MSHANAKLNEIKVLEFKKYNNDEYTIKFTENNIINYDAQHTITVKISYNPRFIALPASRTEFLKAIEYLQNELNSNDIISVWFLSGRGFRPIIGLNGHYRTDALKLVKYGDGKTRVLFIHSDNEINATD